ncbi:D-arabinono-1,4-lactone oxidase [Sphingopyxis indica]|uniref:FAD-linked oxidoreductase n=1 Tax=Sphingopyxis indica TaxID=436663 RepID=A0A239HCJ9_9SPHN|nr:D-arabinono-1,4-lactone oxidase [Sphingopyxis indica]SNS79097.1 FAD-linked oxidoreductase [Sphingopyxis indica]
MNKVTRRALLASGGVIGAGALGVGGLAGRNWLRDREPPVLPAADANGRLLWTNWSGIAHSYPQKRAAPRSEDELLDILTKAPAPIRPVGSGHSFTAIVPTEGTLLTLDGMTGLVDHDAATNRATVRAGTRLVDLGPALAAIGQEMDNLPDINKQSVAGAMSTGTHGTGRGIPAVHGSVIAMRLATPSGEVIDCDATTRPEIFNAARVGVGAFGVVTQVTLQNQPLRRVLKRTEIRPTDEVIEDWPALRQRHRNVEFFPLPFTSYSVVVSHDVTDRPLKPRGPDTDVELMMGIKKLRDWFEFAPSLRRKYADEELAKVPPEDMVDEGWKLLSNERPVRFNEMEYHLPIETQMTALREVLAAIEAHRRDVFFPLEARVIAADDAWLSPFYQRESGSVAVHAYYREDYDFFFSIVEPIFRRHGGRPHWGKLHSLKARDLAQIYPRWRDANEVRRELDPQGRMLNPFLKGLFIDG